MKKITLGISLGILAGIIDIIPMVIQRLGLEALLSAFSLWIVSGFLISTSNLKINGVIKGIMTSFLVLIPCLFIIGLKEPLSLIPIVVMTLILGGLLGYLTQKFGK
jgi:hypothetical protein